MWNQGLIFSLLWMGCNHNFTALGLHRDVYADLGMSPSAGYLSPSLSCWLTICSWFFTPPTGEFLGSVNWEKLDLKPKPWVQYLRMVMHSILERVYLSVSRISRFQDVTFLSLLTPLARLWQQLLSHNLSVEHFVQHGRLRMQPLPVAVKILLVLCGGWAGYASPLFDVLPRKHQIVDGRGLLHVGDSSSVTTSLLFSSKMHHRLAGEHIWRCWLHLKIGQEADAHKLPGDVGSPYGPLSFPKEDHWPPTHPNDRQPAYQWFWWSQYGHMKNGIRTFWPCWWTSPYNNSRFWKSCSSHV